MTLVTPSAALGLALHRERIFDHSECCSYCGEQAQNASGQPFLYRYYYETETGGHIPVNGLFCGNECFESQR